MIKANNADLLQQMITNNKNKELFFSQKIKEQEKRKYEELAEKIQPSLELFWRNYNNSEDESKDNEIKTTFKQRKSKRLIELRKKIRNLINLTYMKKLKLKQSKFFFKKTYYG